MNCAQVIRRALYDANFILQDNTTTPGLVTAELLAWANEAKDKVEKTLRTNDQDYNLLTRASTDSSFRWDGVTYSPADFQLTTTARSYTLPPDMLLIRRIRATTSGEEERTFRHVDISHPEFVSGEQTASTTTTSGEIMWDITGERTLRIHNPPDVTTDIEIAYIPRSRRLQMYTGAGTVATTQDSTTVTGSSTVWVVDAVNAFADLLVSTSTAAPLVATQTTSGVYVDPTATYSPISTIDSATSITLLGAWLPAALTGRGYMIASRFSFPPEHTHMVSDWVAYRALKKFRSADQTSFKKSFDEGLAALVPDTAERQTADPEFVEDFVYE